MKYEKPIAEIHLFGAADIITASPDQPSQPGTVVGDDGGICAYDKTDNYNFDNCL